MMKTNNEKLRQEILRKHQIVEESNKEVNIRKILEQSLIPDDESKKTFADFKKLLIEYFNDSIDHISEPDYIHSKTQVLLESLSNRGNSTIVSGKEYLSDNLISMPVFFATNHLGLYKLATINPVSELNTNDTGVDKMYSLPLFHASMFPVAKLLHSDLYIAAFEFPGVIGKIQKDAGGVVIRLKEEQELDGQGGIEDLIRQTQSLFRIRPNSALTILPEGKTSGKDKGISPYDLEEFRTGAFVVAAKLEIPIIPIAQKFVNNRFEISILEPIYLNGQTQKEDFVRIARDTKDKIQNALNLKSPR